MSGPFQVREEAGALHLLLDTPGSSVNVFGPAAAAQLLQILEALGPRPHVRQLVLRSLKPGSFVNGAGLLYASALRSREQALAVSAPVRRAYEALASAPLSTVAVVEGNCFGCGLELALCCDWRVGRKEASVLFAMTELEDYRFVPLFGGTWRLPRAVGRAGAAALLLDGERWRADEAHARGLLQHLLPSRGFTPALSRLLASLPAAPRAARSAARSPLRYRPPPPRRSPLWRRCAGLLEAAHRRSPRSASAAELRAFAATVTQPDTKRAMSFFFVRQMARAAALGSTERRAPALRLLPPRTPALAPLARALALPPGAVAAEARARTLSVGTRAGLRVHLGPAAAPAAPAAPVELLLAEPQARLVEVAVGPGGEAEAREVARTLEWAGLEPVLTRPRAGFALARLARAWEGALAQLQLRGLSREAVAQALWAVGFPRSPAELRAAWQGKAPRRSRANPARTRAAPGAFEALCAALVRECAALLDDGTLLHAAQADVLVQGLVDFPLEEGSLLQYAERVGLATLLQGAEGAAPAAPHGWLAARLAAGGRVYR